MQTRMPSALLFLAAGLGACGGGSGGNSAPTIAGLADSTIPQDGNAVSVPFTVRDDRTPTDALRFRVEPSDPALLPVDGLEIGGSGGNRFLSVTPAESATGVATVTVRVSDADGAETTRSISLRVEGTPASFGTLASDAFGLGEDEAPRPIRGLAISPDVDDDDLAFSGLLQ